MKSLSGYADDYNEYVEREKKSYVKISSEKKLAIEYAEELKKAIIPNTIVFYANNGYGLSGIPKAILTRILKDPVFNKYKFIIFLRNEEMIKNMKRDGFRNRQLQYENLGANLTSNFYYWLARAQYLVVDGVLPSLYMPREEQTYIQASFLYSGLEQGYLRDMRYTIRSYDYVKNFLAADYIISPSDLYTKEILEDSYYIRNIYQGKILTCQSPVIERLNQMTEKQVRKETKEKKKSSKKEVLVIGSEQHSAVDIAKILKGISEESAMDDFHFYYKPSQVGYRTVRKWMEENPSEDVTLLLNQTDVLPWLKRCDIVVSDYNPNLFYAVHLEKPVVLLDIAKKQISQCEYVKVHMSDLPIVTEGEELRKQLLDVKAANQTSVMQLFSGRASVQDIIDVLAGGLAGSDSSQDEKEAVCVVAAMGHYSKDTLVDWKSQLNIMLTQLVKEGKDVTLFTNEPEAEDLLRRIEKIVPKDVRVIYRIAERLMTKQEMIDSSYLIRNFAFCADIRDAIEAMDVDLNVRDLKRSMGNVAFDTVIYAGPFSGKFVMLTKCISAKQRYYWDQRNYPALLDITDRPEKNQRRFENLCHVPELFDTVLHWDEIELEVIKENHFYEDLQKHKMMKEMLNYNLILEKSVYDTVVFENEKYWVVSSKEYLDEQCSMKLLIQKGDKVSRKALRIDYTEADNLENIMRKIEKCHEREPERIFYVFEDFFVYRKELELLVSNIGMQDYVVLCSGFFLWDILKEFSAYCCVSETKDIYEKVCEYDIEYEMI